MVASLLVTFLVGLAPRPHK